MADHTIDFSKMEWTSPAPGLRHKVFATDDQVIRLAEFSSEFTEQDWCTKGHTGYVLEGTLQIEFTDRTVSYKQGDGLLIETGQKHKAQVTTEQPALLILFEIPGL